ncbi:tyrosyl-DNA phosphodiesterase-domain-containing protein [Roridomyces roridus]|uniref:Tyrosyl-DNA phosphodiesterase-domain-containing protein n=1 Tax=Roridomyces roridus TaxID=1738132 RepID=A0AAD7B024_9AGAR|nr:tyrosyl-DNA phosphodiesterase-domain-containing protein [Roridomyces roridus]
MLDEWSTREQEDLDRAIALSLQFEDAAPPPADAVLIGRVLVPIPRIAPPHASGSNKRAAEEAESPEQRKKRRKLEKQRMMEEMAEDLRRTHTDIMDSKARKLPMKYPRGALRLTRTPGRDHVNTVSLGDLVHPKDLVAAFVFSYCLETDFIAKLFPFKTSPNYRSHCLVYMGTDLTMDREGLKFSNTDPPDRDHPLTLQMFDYAAEAAIKGYSQTHGENCIRFYTKKKGGCIHTKMMILVYPDFMRLMITSANLISSDLVYGDNHFYIQDFPSLSPESAKTYREPKFQADLRAHLEDLECPKDFLPYLRERAFDFSAVKVHLVTSKPATHSKEWSEAYGQLRLRSIVRDHILKGYTKETVPEMEFEACTGSVGVLTKAGLVKNLVESCAGGLQHSIEGRPKLKFVFPSYEDVANSNGIGKSNLGSHINWKDETPQLTRLRRIFHHYQSKDAGCLFHMKLILALRAGQPNALPLYMYIGSHNFSQSAWGNAVEQKGERIQEKWGKLRIESMANTECGVVVPGHCILEMMETRNWEDIVPYVRPSDENRYRAGDKPFTTPKGPQEATVSLQDVAEATGIRPEVLEAFSEMVSGAISKAMAAKEKELNGDWEF